MAIGPGATSTIVNTVIYVLTALYILFFYLKYELILQKLDNLTSVSSRTDQTTLVLKPPVSIPSMWADSQRLDHERVREYTKPP